MGFQPHPSYYLQISVQSHLAKNQTSGKKKKTQQTTYPIVTHLTYKMAATTPTVFVCAATGTQGGAVARQLRSLDWHVHATVRDATKPAAQALADLGVQISVGDWADEPALRAAMAGCNMLFLNLLPPFPDPTKQGEATAARILGIARDVGVRHVVFSSGILADKAERFEELDIDPKTLVAASLASKRVIEKMVMNSGFEFW
jgi:uncharacterized protein YbjT (DUF2867 family)